MPASRPQELHPLFELTFNTRDIEGIMALYEPTAVYVSGGSAVVGHSSIRQIYASILADTGLMTLATRAVVESDEGLAVLYGAWSVGPPSKSEGLSTEVVRRQPDGTWLFAIDIPNTPLR